MKNPCNISIVDDDTCNSFELKTLLEKSFTKVSICLFESGNKFWKELPRKMPEVIFIDQQMPGITGAELATLIREKYPLQKIIFISTAIDREVVEAMYDLGVNAYVLKEENRNDMVVALRLVIDGHSFYSEKIKNVIREIIHENRVPGNAVVKANAPTLTENKYIVLEAAGYSVKEMSDKTNRAPGTIKNHLSNVKDKGLKTERERLVYAVNNKLIRSLEFLLSV